MFFVFFWLLPYHDIDVSTHLVLVGQQPLRNPNTGRLDCDRGGATSAYRKSESSIPDEREVTDDQRGSPAGLMRNFLQVCLSLSLERLVVGLCVVSKILFEMQSSTEPSIH